MAYGPGQISWRVVADHSSNWSATLRNRVQLELQASAERVLATAQDHAPVRTGELKASGKVEQINEFTFQVSFGAELPDARAVYQELGTSHHPAQPYLVPAYQSDILMLMSRLAMTTQGRVTVNPAVIGGVDSDLGGTGGLEVSMG